MPDNGVVTGRSDDCLLCSSRRADIWAVGPDGTALRKLTWGPYDDRSRWLHDGSHLAFSSDRVSSAATQHLIWTSPPGRPSRHLDPAEDLCRRGRQTTVKSPSPPLAKAAMACGRSG
jgi:hypothetical protein